MATGITETVEALNGAGAVSARLIELSRDGIQLTDFVALGTDSALLAKLTAAGVGVQNVPDELKDLNGDEVRELVAAIVGNALLQLQALGLKPESQAFAVLELLPEAVDLIQHNVAFAMKVKAKLDAAKAVAA